MASGKLRIGVDVDDVVADLFTAWLDRINKAYGHSFTLDDLTRWEYFWDDFGISKEEAFDQLTPDIYESEVLPFDGAIQAVKDIGALGHTVVFVSSCYTAEDFKAKHDWLLKYGILGDFLGSLLPVASWSKWKTKNDAPVDWLIDDNASNLEVFTRGYPILVTRPHNRLLRWEGKRIKHLRDVVPMLKYGEVMSSSQALSLVTPQPGDEDMTPAVRQFETGATRDTETGKLDYEAFFSPAVLKRRAEFMHKNRFQRDGSMRAGDNWQKGIPTDVYMKSLARHFMTVWQDYRAGKPLPQEELCAVMFNAEGLLHEDLKKVAS